MRQNIFLHKNSRLTTAAADVVWCIVMYYGIFLFFFQRLLEYFFHSLDFTKVSFSHNKISNPNLKTLTVPYKFSNRSSFEFLIFCSPGTRLAPCVKEKLHVFQNWNLFRLIMMSSLRFPSNSKRDMVVPSVAIENISMKLRLYTFTPKSFDKPK